MISMKGDIVLLYICGDQMGQRRLCRGRKDEAEIDLPLGYHSILLVSFGFQSCLFRKTANGRWYIQTSEGSSEALSIVFLLQTWEGR